MPVCMTILGKKSIGPPHYPTEKSEEKQKRGSELRRLVGYDILFGYFGTMTTRYLQSDRTCGKPYQSCIGFSSIIPQRGLSQRRSLYCFRRIGRTYSGPPLEVMVFGTNKFCTFLQKSPAQYVDFELWTSIIVRTGSLKKAAVQETAFRLWIPQQEGEIWPEDST